MSSSLDDLVTAYQVAPTDQLFEQIASACNPLLRTMQNRFFWNNSDRDDVKQESLIALHAATQKWDRKKGGFRSFAYLVVRRHCIVTMRYHLLHRVPVVHLNFFTRFDAEGNDITSMTIDDCAAEPETKDDALSSILDTERHEQIQAILKPYFTSLEMDCLNGWMNGMSYPEIAQGLGLTPKHIDNGLHRARQKFKKYHLIEYFLE